MLESVVNIVPRGTELISIRHANAAGLEGAIRCAAPAVGNEQFAVLLPDILFSSSEHVKKT